MRLEQRGRRWYVRAAPYSVRHALKGAGLNWDPKERSWWSGLESRAADAMRAAADSLSREASDAAGDRALAYGAGRWREVPVVLLGVRKDGVVAPLLSEDRTRVLVSTTTATAWAEVSDVEILAEFETERSLGRARRLNGESAHEGSTARRSP